MARGSDLFRYSGMANPDITSGARLLLEGLGTPSDLVDKATAKQRLELQDLRQAKQDALATPGTPEWLAAQQAQQDMRISALGAEQTWKMENDPVYQNSLLVMKRETPGSPEWKEAQNIIQEMNISNKREEYKLKGQYDPSVIAQLQALEIAKKDRAGQDFIGNEFFKISPNKVTTTTVTSEDVQKVKEQAESAATVNAGKIFNDEYARLTKPASVLDVDGNGEVTVTKTNPILSEEEAYFAALKKSGLDKLQNGESIQIDPSIVLPKAGTTSKEEKRTAEEIIQLKLDALKTGVEQGKVPAGLAMKVATELQPIKSAKDIREDAKVALELAEFKEKQAKNYYGKSGGSGSGKGDWIKTYDAMIKTYGDPGKYDRPDIEKALSDLQGTKYSDSEMSDAIDSARGVYGGSLIGVDEDGFKKAVKTYLEKLPPKEKK